MASPDNYKTKAVLHLVQVIAGLMCFAFIQVDTGLFSCPPKYDEKMMGQVVSFLEKVAFTFTIVSFSKLVTRFPRSFAEYVRSTSPCAPLIIDDRQQSLDGKRTTRVPSRYGFELGYHFIAYVLYFFPLMMVFTRLSMSGLFSTLWNITAAAVCGVVACLAHMFYGRQLFKEHRQLEQEARNHA